MSQFEVGKTYRTRGGAVFKITAMTATGFIVSDKNWWTSKGRINSLNEMPEDLLPGAIEDEAKPSIPQTDYAFPFTAPDATFCGGMLLRDWFAGQALAGMVGKSTMSAPCDDYADKSYRLADAMMKARGE